MTKEIAYASNHHLSSFSHTYFSSIPPLQAVNCFLSLPLLKPTMSPPLPYALHSHSSTSILPNSATLPRDDNPMTITATSSYKPSPVTQQLGRGKHKPPIASLLSLDMTAYATKIGYTGYRRTPLPHATRRPQ